MNKTLILIDVQKGFNDPILGKRNNPQAESNIELLLEYWRKNRLPVIHIQHLSTSPTSVFRPGQQGAEFQIIATPHDGEQVFTKNVNSAFIGTELETYLKHNDLTNLVIVGLTTDHCVSTTTRMAANLGFHVDLVADATATFERTGSNGQVLDAEYVHEYAIASLREEFAQIVTTQEILSSR